VRSFAENGWSWWHQRLACGGSRRLRGHWLVASRRCTVNHVGRLNRAPRRVHRHDHLSNLPRRRVEQRRRMLAHYYQQHNSSRTPASYRAFIGEISTTKCFQQNIMQYDAIQKLAKATCTSETLVCDVHVVSCLPCRAANGNKGRSSGFLVTVEQSVLNSIVKDASTQPGTAAPVDFSTARTVIHCPRNWSETAKLAIAQATCVMNVNKVK